MISQDQNTALLMLEEATRENPLWKNYAKYCSSREKGLRKEAFNNLDIFLNGTKIWSFGHHLPDYYTGDPYEDIKLSEKIKNEINLLTQERLRSYFMKELLEDLNLIQNYIDWKNSKEPDFKLWGERNLKSIGYGLTRVYYYDNDKSKK